MQVETGRRMRDHRTSVRVFGGVGLETADGPVGVGGARQQRLLALLVVRHGQVVTIEWLAEYLWTDDDRPDAAPTRLRTYMSRLRRTLPEDAEQWIETRPGGYRLVAPPDAIEHVRFARLRTSAREARDTGDPLTARRLLDEALDLWRGEPFRELDDLDWARADIEQLHLDRLEMLEERWETELALGRHTQITGELGSFVSEQPLRERAVRQYALALHRSGRTPEALRVLSAFRRTLADETGLDPSSTLVELERSLLDGDPGLEVPAGRPLRGYRLLEEVGAGAFAIVWRATQPSVGREVAIKQIRSEFTRRPKFIRRFEAEARLVARVEHPHIVPLIDYWRDPDSAYLVMRWLGGETLERRLDDGPMSIDQVISLAEQIGGALSAAHAHGVVHRDVKPSNILFDAAGHAYLTDFGIALGEADPNGPEAALSPGSPAYASPEQLRGEPVGPSADIFGLGVVLYECLVGSPPPRSDATVAELLDPLRHHPYSAARERVGGIPSTIAGAIARATAADPADRYPSAGELVRALHRRVGGPEPSERPARIGPAENPYVGLRAFDDGDADRFFGRDRLIGEIVGRLSGSGVRSRCVVVLGPSGSGKSSVVRAGIVPALRRDAVPGSGEWFTTTMVPGDDVYGSLEAALLRIAVDPPPSLLAELRNGERGILRGVRRCIAGGRDHVVLVIDQLEELFTSTDARAADSFLTALSVAVDDPSSPLKVIATIRADYYDRPLHHRTFARIVKETAVEVTPLAADELVEAVTGPARRIGIEFEPGLVARVTSETVGRASPLPLLQYALSELYERRTSDHVLTLDDFDTVGGIAGALATRAETLYSQADDAERAAIRNVFGRLANPDDVDTRRRVPIADLGADEPVRLVLERFGRARLLTFDRDGATREPTVEVAHEALLREWPRAATWLEDDRELRRTVGSIGAAATAWDHGGRQPSDLYRGGRLEIAVDVAASRPEWLRSVDREFVGASHTQAESEQRAERGRVRRLRRLVGGTAVALVAALVAGGLALTEQRRADRAARTAEVAAGEAEVATLITSATATAAELPDVALLLALEARRRAPGPTTDRALLETIQATALGRQVGSVPRLRASDCGADPPSRIGPDGLLEFGIDGDRLLRKDLVTGEVSNRGVAPEPCVVWFEDAGSGRRWASTMTGDRQWTGDADGRWVDAEVSGRDGLLGGYSVEPGDLPPGGALHTDVVDGRLMYWYGVPRDGPWTADAVVVDARTLAPVGEVVPDLTIDPDDIVLDRVPTAVDEAEALFAVAGSPNAVTDSAGASQVVVLDAVTGAERFRFRRSAPVTALAFGHDARALVSGGEDGVVEIVDLGSHRVIASMTMSESAPVIAVGARPGGDVVAVGRRSIELFDRQGEPIGLPVAIPPSETARVRPDGSVVVAPIADPDTLQVIEPTGGLLVETGWHVDPSARVGFGAGRAGVANAPDDLELVDLDSGVRSPIVPALSDGRRFEAVAVVPEDDGFLAWDRDGSIVRWRAGGVSERLELWSGSGGVTLGRDADGPGRRLPEGTVGSGAATVFLNGFPQAVHRFDPTPGALELISTIGSPPIATVAAAPGPDGGIHVILDDGVVRTYDRAARTSGQVATDLTEPWFAVTDPTTGLVSVGGRRGAVVVDPAAGTFARVAGLDSIAALGFARDGALLVVVATDGTVRLWDIARSEPVGTLWTGSGTAPGAPPWYDAGSDSVWVATSGTLLRFSLAPERWADRVCEFVGRELTEDEWDRFVPGDAPRRDACR